jgi:hypothetical protein
MKTQAQGLYPLYGQQIPRVQIQLGHELGASEHPIVRLLREDYLGRIEQEGAYGTCREPVVVIRCSKRFFKGFRSKQRLGECSTSSFASQLVTNILWLNVEPYSVPIRRFATIGGAR